MATDRQLREVLVAINRVSRKVDRGFEFVDERFTLIDDRMRELGTGFAALVQKQDGKLNLLLDILRRRDVISEKDRARLLATGPYPQQ